MVDIEKRIEKIEQQIAVYSEEPIELESLKKFLELRENFGNYIDKAIEDYFKGKPKPIRCYTYNTNPNHITILTEDNHIHEINIVFKDYKFLVEIREFSDFEKQRDKFIKGLCKDLKIPRKLIEG